jgi:glutamyl/glutaminyl-tRNA synthetase
VQAALALPSRARVAYAAASGGVVVPSSGITAPAAATPAAAPADTSTTNAGVRGVKHFRLPRRRSSCSAAARLLQRQALEPWGHPKLRFRAQAPPVQAQGLRQEGYCVHGTGPVLDPLKVVITNFPEGKVEQMEVENNPEDASQGNREMPFSREIYMERKDFMEDPPKKFFRMGPGRNVRLKGAYILHCEDYVKDESTGEIKEVHCTYYPDSRSGEDTSGIKAKGTLHWVSIAHAQKAEVRLYDRLFTDPTPDRHEDKDFLEFLNPDSLEVIKEAFVEPNVGDLEAGQQFQFLRMGYYCVDPDSTADHWVFNRTVTLRDTWAKLQNKG